MIQRHLIPSIFGALALGLAPAAASAEDEVELRPQADFAVWDANRDGHVDAGEARRGVIRHGARYDRDRDRHLDDRELARMLYEAWDVNGDDRLDYREWTEANDAFLRQEDRVSFGDVDMDASADLSFDEVERGLREMGLRGVWDRDRDGRLGARELGDGLVGSQDRDASGDLDEEEWFAS